MWNKSFLNLFIFNWRIIALPDFVVFCETASAIGPYVPSFLNFLKAF